MKQYGKMRLIWKTKILEIKLVSKLPSFPNQHYEGTFRARGVKKINANDPAASVVEKKFPTYSIHTRQSKKSGENSDIFTLTCT